MIPVEYVGAAAWVALAAWIVGRRPRPHPTPPPRPPAPDPDGGPRRTPRPPSTRPVPVLTRTRAPWPTLRAAADEGRYDDLADLGALTVLDTAPDPGNPDTALRLAADAYGLLTAPRGRILLATNPPTGHGERTTHAIPVAPYLTTALAAAAWTYDVPADVYAGLARRT